MYPRKKLLLGALRGKIEGKGQASLEMVVAIVSVLLLLIGVLRFFFWVNKRFILRQEAYESEAIQAANHNYPTNAQPEIQVDEIEMPPLDLEILGRAK